MKMLTKNLNKIINVELHRSEKENSSNWHYLTILSEVLQKSFNIADKSIDQIEDFLLDCINIKCVFAKENMKNYKEMVKKLN